MTPRLVRVVQDGFVYHHAYITESEVHTHYSMKRVLLFHPDAEHLTSEVIDMTEWLRVLGPRIRHDH